MIAPIEVATTPATAPSNNKSLKIKIPPCDECIYMQRLLYSKI